MKDIILSSIALVGIVVTVFLFAYEGRQKYKK